MHSHASSCIRGDPATGKPDRKLRHVESPKPIEHSSRLDLRRIERIRQQTTMLNTVKDYTRQKKWRLANPDRAKQSTKKWRLAHVEQDKKRRKIWREQHREHSRIYALAYSRKRKEIIASKAKIRREKARLTCLAHYAGGKPLCILCGETDLRTLGLDHIENDRNGASSIKYSTVVNTGFPAGFQTLCANCNIAKHRNGGFLPIDRANLRRGQ